MQSLFYGAMIHSPEELCIHVMGSRFVYNHNISVEDKQFYVFSSLYRVTLYLCVFMRKGTKKLTINGVPFWLMENKSIPCIHFNSSALHSTKFASLISTYVPPFFPSFSFVTGTDEKEG